MAKNGSTLRVTVGKDIDNTQTIRTQFMKEESLRIAMDWAKYKYPVPMDDIWTVGAVRVRVRVEEAMSAEKIRVSDEQYSHE